MHPRAKLLTTLLILAAAAALILWNARAQAAPPALGVSDAKRQAEQHLGREVSVRGSVVEGSILQEGSTVLSFVLADGSERLLVRYNQTPPDNFGVKEVVVRGVLAQDAQSAIVLHATAIQVGCSSKY